MPAQSNATQTPEYAVGDTDPPLRVQLLDGDGTPIDLTGASVAINVAWSGRQSVFPYSTYFDRLIDGGSCTVDPDQTTYTGFLSWTPGANDLSEPGSFSYNFEVTFPGGWRRTITPAGTNTLIIRPPLGGMNYA